MLDFVSEAQLRTLSKQSPQYRALTDECFKVDMHALRRCEKVRQEACEWVRAQLQGNGPGIAMTRHSVVERLRS